MLKDRNHEKPKILKSEIVASSRLFSVEQLSLLFSNGEQRTYERLRGTRGTGTVMIIPLLDDNDTVLLVREYAAGMDRYEIGLPKGVLEVGEEVFEAANRELKEEVGMGAKQFTLFKLMTTAPGYQGGKVHTVLARDLYPDTLPGDEPEPIEIIPWKLSELTTLLAREDFTEARSVAALFLLRDFLQQHSQE